MSDSIGQISLDLGLDDITEKQIENISGKIKANITKALGGLSNIGNINKTLGDVKTTIQQTVNSIHSQIKNNLAELKSYIEGIFSKLKVKNPMENFLNKENSINSKDVGTTKTTRGPPISVKVPKIDLSNNTEYIKSQLENLTVQLDQVGAKADEERYKIKDLRKEIENLSKPTGNKAMDFINQEQIKKLQIELSKAEQRLNKFASTSDKTVFSIDVLEKKLSELGSATKSSSAKVEEASSIFSRIKNKISSSIKAGIGSINTLKSGSNFSNKLKGLGRESTNTGRSFLGMGNMISRSLGRVLKQVLIIRVIYRALRGLISYTSSALMTNAQFVHSLNQIRTNLMVAFMPIYQAVLPALNALMSALSTITAYIATFISAIFGKTYKQSFNATKGLNKARAAMGSYGKTAKKTAKEVKEAQNSLMGFDEINSLSKNHNTSPKDEDSGMPPMVMPDVDVSPASAAGKAVEGIAKKVKAVLATIFQPFKNAWAKEGAGVTIEFKKAIEGTKGTIRNFFDMLATPPVQNFIESIARLGLKIGKLFLFIYNNYLLPLINWLIEKTPFITELLTPLFNGISNFIEWLMGDGKPVLDIMVTVLGSLFLSFKLVTGAVRVFNAVTGMIALIKSPIGIAVLAIGAIIAVGILLVKHWDTVKAVASAVWNGIKDIFKGFIGWIDGIFTKDWTKSFGLIGNVLNAFFGGVKGIWGGIKRVFSGIIDFIAGVFTGNWSRAWKGVVNIFGGIFDGIKALVKAPLNFVIGLINGVIGGLNKIKLPDWVPLIGGKGINIPKIPKLATGGYVKANQPQLAMIGDNKTQGEIVAPEGKMMEVMTQALSAFFSKMEGQGNSNNNNSGDLTVELYMDSNKMGDVIVKSFRKLEKKTGKVLLPI